MRSLSILLLLVTLFPTTAQVVSSSGRYTALKQEAERSIEEKSFARARDLYAEAAKLQLDVDERRWVTFRLADTTWRATVSSPSADPTVLDSAREALLELVRQSGGNHDRIWAEAQESLGDSWMFNPYERNHGAATPYYTAALDWWAGSADVDLARKRYLSIVFRMADTGEQRYYGYGYVPVPREVLVNAVAIATDPADLAHARFLLGSHLLASGTPRDVERGLELLDLVIDGGKQLPDHDDALYLIAQRLSQGVTVIENGVAVHRPDFARALKLYERLAHEYTASQTRYHDEARAAIAAITRPSIVTMVNGSFLPASEQEVFVSSRNVKEVALRIIPVDLPRDLRPTGNGNLAEQLSLDGKQPVRQWSIQPIAASAYAPVTDRVRITPKLERGTYVFEAAAAGHRTRALVTVTDTTIVLHHDGERIDVYVANVLTGKPLTGVPVRLWQEVHRNPAQQHDASTNASGLASITTRGENRGTIIVASGGAAPAYVSTYAGYRHRPGDEWRVYAFTDRPAYRPDETVQWKIIARVSQDEVWRTPAGDSLEYEITGPRGEKLATGVAKLGEYGTFSGSVDLTRSMALGEYHISLKKRGEGARWTHAGLSRLFRLEEYKLPEFRVEVSAGDDAGRPRQYRLGDTIEAAIDASYYFGGPVAHASVEVVIRRNPFFRHWHHWRAYPWYWTEPHHGYGEEIRRETRTTDANGRATVRIETFVDEQESEYTIEARVVDASRREVSGSGTVRVTRQRYSVGAQPQRYIVKPGEKASVDFKAVDANDRPVKTEGTVRVVRRQWEESWIDPAGREVSGRELDRLRAAASFPPPTGEWRNRFARYRDEELLVTTLSTNTAGEATFTFTPAREGYYSVTWSSEDRREREAQTLANRVTAETSLFVTERGTQDLGYRAGGLEIILDKETYRASETAMAMIATPASGRWVFLTSTATGILESQVIHLDGTVKLVPIPLDARHSPSFHLTATSVFDRSLATQTKQLVVPPVEKFLDVDVKLDREQYEPRSAATVTVTTRDVDGKPVAAEVAIAVTDESVTAIAQDPAGDPRKHFFGTLRQNTLRVDASVTSQRYLKLVEVDSALVDEREAVAIRARREAKEEMAADQMADGAVVGGVVGGMVGAPPPPPMPAPAAVAEAITVTASAPQVMESRSVMSKQTAANAEQPQQIAIEVRSDFHSTAFWQPDVLTGPDGKATVDVKFPESLTTWRATARAVTPSTQVGMSSATARTSMPLVVRLQAPRFFVEGDQATISAVLNNNTGEAVRVTPTLEADGITIVGAATAAPVVVKAQGETRVDWKVAARKAGTARLRVSGNAGSVGDAMEKTFTVHEHGISNLVARSGKLRGTEALIRLDLPRERRDAQLLVHVQPSIAVTMLDALPYLVQFPYGCTEQTMSRFLPAAIVARTLAQGGLSSRDIENRIFGGIERAHVDATHPEGSRDFPKLRAVTDASLNRLYDFQHHDGGWGWWKEGSSDPFMTAYVVWGFALAKESGIAVRTDAVSRAAQWLDTQLVREEDNLHDQVWILHAITQWKKAAAISGTSEAQQKALENIWQQREKLTAYSRALFTIATADSGQRERALVLARNLENGVKIDRAPDKSVLLRGSGANAAETMATAHWGEDRSWWRWHDGAIESTAFTLRALLKVDPKHALIEPAMNWLVKNRRGAQWNNTRDTAIAILALTDYMKASGELSSASSWDVLVNGTLIGSYKAPTALDAPAAIAIDPALVQDANEIVVRRTGSGPAPLYFAVEGRFFSLEEPVKAAGNEIFVRRDYFRLAPRPTLLKGVTYDRVPLRDGDSIASGERVEVVVTVESKNDYDYLLFEDLKPAGLEAVELQSGTPLYATELRASAADRRFAAGDPAGEQPTVVQRSRRADQTNRSVWTYQELRDRKVAMFIDHLPQGIWEIRYSLRAEVPGVFHALPLLGQAMYVPEIRANGDEVRIKVTDEPVR